MKPKTVLNKSPYHVSNQRKKDVIAIKSKFMQFDPEPLFQSAIKTYFVIFWLKTVLVLPVVKFVTVKVDQFPLC